MVVGIMEDQHVTSRLCVSCTIAATSNGNGGKRATSSSSSSSSAPPSSSLEGSEEGVIGDCGLSVVGLKKGSQGSTATVVSHVKVGHLASSDSSYLGSFWLKDG